MARMGTDYAKTHLGTPQTMGPEILFTDTNYVYSNKTDLWSIGVTYYMMQYGMKGPFDATDMVRLKKSIMDRAGDKLQFDNSIPVSEDSKKLLISQLQLNPDDRLDWKDFFNHKIFEKDQKSSLDEKKQSVLPDMNARFKENAEQLKKDPAPAEKNLKPAENDTREHCYL